MSEQLQNLKQSLSALMDSEADDLELRRVLRTLSTSSDDSGSAPDPDKEELLATWDRYHQVRSALHSESASHAVPAGFMARLKTAIDAEPVHAEDSREVVQPASGNRPYRWLSAFGQGAVAASVAAMVLVFSWDALNGSPEATTAPMQTASSESAQPDAVDFSQVANISGKLDEDSLARLRQAVYREFENDSESLEIPVSYRFDEE